MTEIDADEVLKQIKHKIQDPDGEQRVRDLHKSVTSAFETGRAQGVKKVLDQAWTKIKTDFDSALLEVKKDTGLV